MAAKKKKAHAHAHAHTHGGKTHTHAHDHDHAHSHDHGHAHDHHHHHDHAHDHDHDHDHAHGTVPVPPLARHAGVGKVLFFDAPSGLAGDMIIASLVDLGVPPSVIEDAVATLPIGGFHLHFGTRTRSGIVATHFDVHVEEAQPERTYREIRAMLDRAKLDPAVRKRAHATFRRLAEAEARVHRMPLDDVHFHEVGAIDAIVDVVGSAAALEYVGARVLVSDLPMGHGRVKARHGILPLPPPAVVESLKGFPTYDAKLAFELVTPTGAAIVAAHAKPAGRWPRIAAERTGFGAGTAELADRANMLRVVLGEDTQASASAVGDGAPTHVVLEANVDDASPELLAVCVDALLHEGALDAWVVPATMKKGRPGHVLAALADVSRSSAIAAAMLRESTTIGVRITPATRIERPRRFEDVKTPYGVVPVKVSEGSAAFGPPQRKPELDACVAAARAHGVPVRQVIEAALVAAHAAAARAARAAASSSKKPAPKKKAPKKTKPAKKR